MGISNSFAQKIIEKLVGNPEYHISIANKEGLIIASHSADRINSFDQAAIKAVNGRKSIELEGTRTDITGARINVVALPLLLGSEAVGAVIIEGNLEIIRKVADIIKSTIETMLEYNLIRDQDQRKLREEEALINDILTKKSPGEIGSLVSYLRRLGYNLDLSRSIILIEFERKENRYFNINLNLGYDTSIENLKNEMVRQIKENRYLTNQDIVGFYGENQILVIKSFIKVSDTEKIYRALEKICSETLSILSSFKIFSFHIACGNIYSNLSELKNSYREAQDIIKLGRIIKNNPGVHSIEDMLLESVGYYLPSMIMSKAILPVINKMKNADGTLDMELLNTVEGLIDNCFNFSRASRSLFLHRNTIAFRLEKFKKLTGLDPSSSFEDAFLIKMVAIYIKISKII